MRRTSSGGSVPSGDDFRALLLKAVSLSFRLSFTIQQEIWPTLDDIQETGLKLDGLSESSGFRLLAFMPERSFS